VTSNELQVINDKLQRLHRSIPYGIGAACRL